MVPHSADSSPYRATPCGIPRGAGQCPAHGNTPPEMKIGDIPRLLGQSLELAGITDATVGPAPTVGWRYGVLGSLGPAVRTVLCGSPLRTGGQRNVPPVLIDVAVDWLRGEYRPGWELRALLIAAEIPVTWDTLRSVIDDGLKALSSASVVATNFATGAAALALGECLGCGVAMSAVEAEWATAGISSRMRQMREAVRGQAPRPELWLASVTVQPDSRSLPYGELTNWSEDLASGLVSDPVPGAAATHRRPAARRGRTTRRQGGTDRRRTRAMAARHPAHDAVCQRAERLLAGG